MKWIARERPKIDRIACPRSIKKFIDGRGCFHYAWPCLLTLPA